MYTEAERRQEAATLYFDDVAVGNLWRSPAQPITQRDVHEFAELTGDRNPLHLSPEFASATPFRRPIAHGLLGLSRLAGLSSEHPLMETLAFVGISEWKFLKPIYYGDSLLVETEITAKQATNRRHGLIVWHRRLINQDNEIVQQGSFETLVRIRAAVVRSGLETSVV